MKTLHSALNILISILIIVLFFLVFQSFCQGVNFFDETDCWNSIKKIMIASAKKKLFLKPCLVL